MKATIVAYKLHLDTNGDDVFCGTVIVNVGMQPAGYPEPGTWWRGAGRVPHPEYSGDNLWKWIAFREPADAELDAAEAWRQGHDAVVLGEMDIFRRPWGWGSPAVTDAVRRVMMAEDCQLQAPEQGDMVIVA